MKKSPKGAEKFHFSIFVKKKQWSRGVIVVVFCASYTGHPILEFDTEQSQFGCGNEISKYYSI